MPLKILHTEASMGWGGQEIRILRESEGMRQLGHEVTIMACPGSRLLARAAEGGFCVQAVLFRRRNAMSILHQVKAYIEEHAIDVVNTHSSKDSWIALPAARLAKNRPFAIRTRHLSTPIGKDIPSRLLYMHFPHAVFTTGEAIKTQMVSLNRFNPDRIISIPTGVDTRAFHPDMDYRDIRDELHLARSVPLVGSVSVLRSWKGLDYFARAVPLILREMPDARFIIAGEGPYRAKLEETVQQTGESDKIYLLGHREDVADILCSLDIVVHPSYANEGVPQTVLQALSMQKPVVATSLEALTEVVIHRKTGLIVPPRDADGLAREVVGLLRNRDAAKEMGVNGRRLAVERYSFEGMIRKIESIYLDFFRKKELAGNA